MGVSNVEIRRRRRRRGPLGGLVRTAMLLLACDDGASNVESERVEAARELVAPDPRAWFETQKLVIDEGLLFGSIVAVSGTTAVVGSPNRGIHAYSLTGGAWNDTGELDVSGESTEEYGFSAAISGDTIVIGTPGHSTQRGSVHVFSPAGSSWRPSAELFSDSAEDDERFGAAVAVEGDLAIVGAPYGDSAYVFARDGERWLRQKQLRPSDARTPASHFGAAVAISGNRVVVGAPRSGNPPEFHTAAGKVYVYAKPEDLSGRWREEMLVANPRTRSDLFGFSVAVQGDTVLVGATGSAAAYFFTSLGSGWSAQKLTPARAQASRFGASVAISNGRAAIGGPLLASEPGIRPGGVYVLRRVETGWSEIQTLMGAVTEDGFGSAVGIAGDTLIVGVPNAAPGGAAIVERLRGTEGRVCAVNAECGLGHCVSGVCCNTACEGACEECVTGTCRPLPAGNPGLPECRPYLCDGSKGSCPERCLASDDCVDGHYCRDGSCVAKARLGATCSGPGECVSGHCLGGRCWGTLPNGAACDRASDCDRGNCVDGVCCNDACAGQCEACDVPRHEGECTPVIGSPRGEREPCAGVLAECRGSCDGETTAVCSYPSGGTCASSCKNGSETISVCDGRGDCIPQEERSCGDFVCDAEEYACVTECRSDDDCSNGRSCWNDKTCGPRVRCASDHESATAPGDVVQDCGAFRCGATGTCNESCATAREDCRPPYACDSNQRCVLPSSEDSGCGCRAAPRSSSSIAWAGVLAMSWLLALRRARSRRPFPWGLQ